MTPYKNTGNLTAEQKKYNAIHSSSHCCEERCIGLLKGKFRRLKNFDAQDDVLMCKLLVGCAVVHNVILSQEGVDELLAVEASDVGGDTSTVPSRSDTVSAKRNKICSELFVLLL